MADEQQDQQQHPPEKKAVTRRFTTTSQKTTKSALNFLRRGVAPTKTQGGPVQDHVPCYGGLPWDAVHRYLEPKFPAGWNFRESKMDDRWTFVVPRKLTSEEKMNLNDLRESEENGQGSRERRPSVSDEE